MQSGVKKLTETLVRHTSAIQLSRSFTQENVNFQKVNLNTSAIDRLSAANGLTEVMEVVDNFNLQQTLQGSISSFKHIARLLNGKNNKEIVALKQKDAYKNLLNKIRESIDTLNEQDIVDILLSMRRIIFNVGSTGFKNEETEAIKKRANTLLAEGKFSPRQLVGLLSGYNGVGFWADSVAFELLKAIKQSPSSLNLNNYLQILSAGHSNVGYNSINENLLFDEVCKQLFDILPQLPYSKKADVFLSVARLEMQYKLPKLALHPIINKLRLDLKENIDKLNEQDVIKIFQAYRHLPRGYYNDLIEELREMIVITLNHNPTNLNSEFLFNFISSQSNIVLRRPSKQIMEAINYVFTFIAGRMETDIFLKKHIAELAEMAEEFSIKSPAFEEAIKKSLKNNPEFFDRNIVALEFLLRRGVNVSEILKKVIASPQFQEITTARLRRLQVSLKSVDKELYSGVNILEAIENHKNFNNTDFISPQEFQGLFSHNNVENAVAMSEKIIDQMAKRDEIKINSVSNLFECITNSKVVNQLLEKHQETFTKLSMKEINVFIDAYSELKEPSIAATLFLVSVLERNIDKVNSNKLISLFLSKGDFICTLAIKADWLLARIVGLIEKIPDLKKTIRTHFFFSLINRLYANGLENQKLLDILSENFAHYNNDLTKKSQSLAFDMKIAEFLADHDALKLGPALSLFNRIKTFPNAKINSKLLSVLLSNNKVPAEIKKEVESFATKLISHNYSKLTDGEPKVVIDNLISILRFPISNLREQAPFIAEVLKNHTTHFTPKSFLDLINAISTEKVRYNLDILIPILKETAQIFQHVGSKMRHSDIVDTIECFSDLGYRSSFLLNNLLKELSRVFANLKTEDFISLIESFSFLGIKQSDLFDRCLQEILKSKEQISSEELETILKSAMRVGYDSEYLKSQLLTLLEKSSINLDASSHAVSFILSLDAKNEKQLLQYVFDTIARKKLLDKKYRPYRSTGYMFSYKLLESKYPEYAQLWEKMHEGSYQGFQQQSAIFTSRLVQSYLDSMKISYTPNRSFADDLLTLTEIPEQKIIINPIKPSTLNYDKFSPRGVSKLYRRVLDIAAAKDGLKVININMQEFIGLKKDLDRVNYLTKAGVATAPSTSYDFSNIIKKEEEANSGSEDGSSQERKGKKLRGRGEKPAPPVEEEKSTADASTASDQTDNKKTSEKKSETKERKTKAAPAKEE